MAIKHRYTILCEHFLTDQGGKDSYIGSFVNMGLVEIPGSLSVFFVVVAFSGEPGDQVSISIRGPNGKILKDLYDGEVPKSKLNRPNRIVSAITAFPLIRFRFEFEGIYHVVLRHGKRIVSKQPFGVYKKEQASV